MKGARKRPNALGSNSQRFANVPGPDGQTLKIPQAKDSLTALYIANSEGGWPEKHVLLLAYNETELTTGSVVELEELRPGHGMGGLKTLRVLDVRLRIERWSGSYGRAKRFVLLEEMPDRDAELALTADDLDGPQ